MTSNFLTSSYNVEYKGQTIASFSNKKVIDVKQTGARYIKVEQATKNAFVRNALGNAIIEWSKAIGKDIKVVNNDEQLTALRQGRDAMLNGIGLLDQFINYVKEGKSNIITFKFVK